MTFRITWRWSAITRALAALHDPREKEIALP